MMLTENPIYRRARNDVVNRFRQYVHGLRLFHPILFICGKQESENRETLANYLRRHHQSFYFFYAERVWESLAENEDLDALQLEEELAVLADAVTIIVESPGTFTELGAFSLHERLRKKVIAILDKKYRNEDSFINMGPVRLLDSGSQFAPCIYADFESFDDAVIQFVKRINMIQVRGRPAYGLRSQSVSDFKNTVFLAADVVGVIGPSTAEEVRDCVGGILGESEGADIGTILGLLESMELIHSIQKNDVKYYQRVLREHRLESMLHGQMFDINRERARFISKIQRIPGAIVTSKDMLDVA